MLHVMWLASAYVRASYSLRKYARPRGYLSTVDTPRLNVTYRHHHTNTLSYSVVKEHSKLLFRKFQHELKKFIKNSR